ncbi:hypothetical protein [Bradyrhizobium sp. Ai1a-2]|uniref:hypothetical protein n=1 Tax=Bradyrhizobium sp. Ai1a-2 TaxID=196490 RepID=UPI001FCB0C8F|nr:hypothetical protein [Bradyrhizobium sp. Ai1a-2]
MNYRPQMATMRPRVMAMPKRVARDNSPIIIHSRNLLEAGILARVLSFVPDREFAQSNLAYGDVVFGGLGLRRRVDCSAASQARRCAQCRIWHARPSVQKGRLSSDRQIGRTRRPSSRWRISLPSFSGASQHRVGVEGADLIVGNNAPFEFARIAIGTDATCFMAGAHSRITCPAIAAFPQLDRKKIRIRTVRH